MLKMIMTMTTDLDNDQQNEDNKADGAEAQQHQADGAEVQ
jgi:hypothetical protein